MFTAGTAAILEVLLWTSLGLVAYAYFGYPLLVWLLARFFGRRELPPAAPQSCPTVSLLICALNEEACIAERVLNGLDQDYPADHLQVVVASDGSTDRTAEIVHEIALKFPGRVILHDFSVRRGKATALNTVIPTLESELVVLSDANTSFDRHAVRNLTRWFARSGIVAVCGQLVLRDPATGRNVDSVYWRYENFLKNCEAAVGALLGANGAVYAIRRHEYIPIAADSIIDDFLIPLQLKLQTGGRLIYDADAVAVEETPPEIADEFRRRVRIGAGGFQSLCRLWPLLLPSSGMTAVAFLSHKLLRWVTPFFLLVALIANALLLGQQPAYRLLFALQAAFYTAAGIGHFVPGHSTAPRLLRLTTLFTSMNVALAFGFGRWLRGTQRPTWHRTAR
jgi:cellulose synthase/poly-beta-1,6-N-acetylglucosamine synthase-like glycosyltransferase